MMEMKINGSRYTGMGVCLLLDSGVELWVFVVSDGLSQREPVSFVNEYELNIHIRHGVDVQGARANKDIIDTALQYCIHT